MDFIAPMSVVSLLFIGFFKGAPLLRGLPVDLTVVSVAILATLLATRVVLSQGRLRISPWAMLAFALALPAAFYPVTNPAVLDKRVQLLLPLIAVIGACYLVGSEPRRRIWVWLHVAVGMALVSTGTTDGDSATIRFAGAGSNAIGAGRASGVAILVLLVLLMTGGIHKWWLRVVTVAVVGWLTVALISTGSRGPIFACAAAVLLVASLALNQRRALRLFTSVGAVVAGWLLLADATGLGATRISKTLTGQYDLAESRSALWMDAAGAAAHNPLGIGWGNFWAVLSPAERLDSGYVQYPHNFILEIFLEAGWLAGAAVVVLVTASLLRLRRGSRSPYGSALLGIAIFFVLNASVSGDVNDNRMMWAALAMAWADRFEKAWWPASPSWTRMPSLVGYKGSNRNQ